VVQYSPRAQFQSNTVQREAWSQQVRDPLFHRAIAAAQAELALKGFEPHEMRGANALIFMLLNLAEEIETVKPLPTKPLKSFDDSGTTTTYRKFET